MDIIDLYYKKTINYKYINHNLKFMVSQSLFSSQKIDNGTQRLLRTLISENVNNFNKTLDLGCGYGSIGITLKKICPSFVVHMVDKDALAIEYTKANLKINNIDSNAFVYGSLGYSSIKDKDFGIKVKQVKLNINEIQSKDTLLISKHKVEEAFKIVNEPIVIADTSWSIPSLNGFPGGYMKDVSSWFEAKDFINLLKSKKDKRISFTECIVYKDKDITKVLSCEYWGIVSSEPKGRNGTSIEQVAEFNGYTIAEKHDIGELSHNPEEYIWCKFAKWYLKYRVD
ncbi:MAG: non-canonical purine NTP pyrophosphatase [Patescibacteria group bacterium]